MPKDIRILYYFIDQDLVFSELFKCCGGGLQGLASLNFLFFGASPESETHGGREILGTICQIVHLWQTLGFDICLLTPWCWTSHSSSLHFGNCPGQKLPCMLGTLLVYLPEPSLSHWFWYCNL